LALLFRAPEKTELATAWTRRCGRSAHAAVAEPAAVAAEAVVLQEEGVRPLAGVARRYPGGDGAAARRRRRASTPRGSNRCQAPPRNATGRQVAHAPGQPTHWPNRGRVGSMRDLGTWSTQQRTSTSRSVPGKARIWWFTP